MKQLTVEEIAKLFDTRADDLRKELDKLCKASVEAKDALVRYGIHVSRLKK